MKNSLWVLLLTAAIAGTAPTVHTPSAAARPLGAPSSGSWPSLEASADNTSPAIFGDFADSGDFEVVLAPVLFTIPFESGIPQFAGAGSSYPEFPGGVEITDAVIAVPVSLAGAPEPGSLQLLCAALAGLALIGQTAAATRSAAVGGV